jgi:hypothetical protein
MIQAGILNGVKIVTPPCRRDDRCVGSLINNQSKSLVFILMLLMCDETGAVYYGKSV